MNDELIENYHPIHTADDIKTFEDVIIKYMELNLTTPLIEVTILYDRLTYSTHPK